MINSYPSIYNLGHKAITDLFKHEVIVEEKVDGSQFSFMKDDDGTLHFRSKGAEIHAEAPEKMFSKAVEAVKAVADRLPPRMIFRGEYLSGPKHNTLCYDRHPNSHIIIFDIDGGNEDFMSYDRKKAWAEQLGFEVVPLLFEGMISDPEALRKLLDTVSVLGGQKIEGVVIKPKNYDLFGKDHHVLMGKFVSEAFKEVHQKEWKNNKTPTNNDVINILTACYGTETRWNKAIQHLAEAGKLEDSPKDIGGLMAEVPADVLKECEDDIKDKLFKWAWPQLKRALTRGLPEWYKGILLEKQFQNETQTETNSQSNSKTNSMDCGNIRGGGELREEGETTPEDDRVCGGDSKRPMDTPKASDIVGRVNLDERKISLQPVVSHGTGCEAIHVLNSALPVSPQAETVAITEQFEQDGGVPVSRSGQDTQSDKPVATNNEATPSEANQRINPNPATQVESLTAQQFEAPVTVFKDGTDAETAVPVLADANKPTMSSGRAVVVDRTDSGEARESNQNIHDVSARGQHSSDSRGGSQFPFCANGEYAE